MEHDDDIEKISRELEEMLSLGLKRDKPEKVFLEPRKPDRQEPEPDIDIENLPKLRLDIPVDGMEELFEGEDYYNEEIIMKSAEDMNKKSYMGEASGDEPDSYEEDYQEREEYGGNPAYTGRHDPESQCDNQEVTERRAGPLKPVREKRQRSSAYRSCEKRHLNLIKPTDSLIAAFLVPVIVMIIIFAQRGIFPFGEESFLRTDMYHQYAPFFSEFRYKLTHGGSLFYSWDVGMGVNFAALYAYYLASPLNWLIVFCPQKYIIEFMTYMIVLKIGLSGLSFAWYLRRHNKTMDFGIAFFGIFYALSGYMAAYSWNIMWLDCILLFPLIMLGLERLVNEKRCFLYCITLGLSILSNYYISIMICIFMVLYFASLMIIDIVEGEKPWKEIFLSLWNFAIYSLLAGGLAAFVLLPEIYALQSTASGKLNFPQTVDSYFSILDMIARHLPVVETEIGLKHWPNIYCGVAVLLFFLLYLGCKSVNQTKKVVMCGLFLFFYASFSINILNFIWHGFHFPNSLPCRQSFIYCFLILSVCYEAYIRLKQIPWKYVVMAFFASVAFVLIAEKVVSDGGFEYYVFYSAIVFLGIYTGLICLYQKGVSKNILVLAALGVVSLEAAVNTAVTSVTTTSRTNYTRDNDASIRLTEGLMPNVSFYRVEKVSRKTKNDGAWMNFPSVSLFSSTANKDLSEFFRKIGCESSTNAYSITGSTPLVDSLFAVKYALFSEETRDTGLSHLISLDDEMYLQKNDFTLPLGFMVPYDLENNWRLELTNPAEVQNDLSVVLGGEPVLSEVPGEVSQTQFTFTPETDGDYYVFFTNKNIKKVTALLGEKTKNFDNVNRGYLLELGYLLAGEPVKLLNDDKEGVMDAKAYLFRPEGLESVYNILNKNGMTLTKWTDTRIEGNVEAEKAGLLFLSIPYDKGWTIRVDGKIVDPYKVFDTFLSVHMTAGAHTVSMEYSPEGLKEGIMITAGSVLVVLALAGLAKKTDKKQKPMRAYKK